MREVHFDQVNRDLRLPRDGGDYEIDRSAANVSLWTQVR